MNPKLSLNTEGSQPRHSVASKPALTPPAISYLGGMIGLSMLASGLAFLHEPPLGIHVILLWSLVALAGELMLFPTATGRGHINLGMLLHMAMILTLPTSQALAAVWISRSVAKFLLHRQLWYRSLFNVAQVAAAVLLGSVVYRSLGGPSEFAFTVSGILQTLPALLGAAAVYYVVNTVGVAGVIAITSQDSVLRAWRENYGYAAEALSSVALVLLSPIAALCYQNLGWLGLAVVLVPMLFIRASSVKYIALKSAQEKLVATERLAAKGEIAAEVGHEINNYLAGAYGQIQLLIMKGEKLSAEDTQKRLHSAMEQLSSISNLSRGLVDSSAQQTSKAPTDLGRLVETTVEFVKPQNRFDNVEFRLDLDPRVADVPVDPSQLQQAVMNLLLNAGNAMEEAETPRRSLSVWVRLYDATSTVEIGVADSGPGVPERLRSRVFEPGFTTRSEGHGFGLATTHQIVANHGGTIQVEDSLEGGALFRIQLPLRVARAA